MVFTQKSWRLKFFSWEKSGKGALLCIFGESSQSKQFTVYLQKKPYRWFFHFTLVGVHYNIIVRETQFSEEAFKNEFERQKAASSKEIKIFNNDIYYVVVNVLLCRSSFIRKLDDAELFSINCNHEFGLFFLN